MFRHSLILKDNPHEKTQEDAVHVKYHYAVEFEHRSQESQKKLLANINRINQGALPFQTDESLHSKLFFNKQDAEKAYNIMNTLLDNNHIEKNAGEKILKQIADDNKITIKSRVTIKKDML